MTEARFFEALYLIGWEDCASFWTNHRAKLSKSRITFIPTLKILFRRKVGIALIAFETNIFTSVFLCTTECQQPHG